MASASRDDPYPNVPGVKQVRDAVLSFQACSHLPYPCPPRHCNCGPPLEEYVLYSEKMRGTFAEALLANRGRRAFEYEQPEFPTRTDAAMCVGAFWDLMGEVKAVLRAQHLSDRRYAVFLAPREKRPG